MLAVRHPFHARIITSHASTVQSGASGREAEVMSNHVIARGPARAVLGKPP
jgi:hypothetical protein